MTIRLLEQRRDEPVFHLAYYNGAHFPYGDAAPLLGITDAILTSYQGAVSAMDGEIGRLLSALAPQAERGELLILITADHGESTFDGGIVGHSSALTDEQMVVPFGALGADDTRLPASQDEIPAYLFSQLGLSAFTPSRSHILSNCSVEVPTGFAVIDGEARADFLYEDGVLSPVASPDGNMPPRAIQLRAARILSDRIAAEN